MSAEDFSRSTSLFTATSLCGVTAMVLALARVAGQLHRERSWTTKRGWRSWLSPDPEIWWRWQKSYPLGTPVTLAIAAAFAFSLDCGA